MQSDIQPRRRRQSPGASSPASETSVTGPNTGTPPNPGETAVAHGLPRAHAPQALRHQLPALWTASPEMDDRSLSFSAPTSPFLPRSGARSGVRRGSMMPPQQQLRARTYVGDGRAAFGDQEAALPLLPAPLSQQASPTTRHHRALSSTHGAEAGFSPPTWCSPQALVARRSSTAQASPRPFAVDIAAPRIRNNISDDDDDDDDDGNSSGGLGSSNNSVGGSFDADIDEDSMALDDTTTNDAASALGRQPLRLDGAQQRRQSVSSAPRNKAFERLRSLVEEDRKPLASEMEHEGHITRSIRHSSVQEWLRSSSSPASLPPPASLPLASPPLDDAKPQGRILLLPARAARENPDALRRDAIPFPASPASSAVSSPRLQAFGPSSCPATACGPLPPSVRLGKRKSMDDDSDDGGPGGDNQASSSGGGGSSSSSVSRAHQAYKRQAMSPSRLRAQIAISKGKRMQSLVLPRSGPSSPLLVSRPTMPLPTGSSAGTCPPLGGSRTRSRSGAALMTGIGAGVFSRMNINDGNAGDDTKPGAP